MTHEKGARQMLTRVEESEDLHQPSTIPAFLASGLASSWPSRKDFGDISDFARQLRQKAEHQWHEE